MVPPQHLSPKVLAALGLLGCERTSACLSVNACLGAPYYGDDTGDTGDTGLGPCLSAPADSITNENRDADPISEAVEAGPTHACSTVLARGGLPEDIARRIQKAFKP